MEKNKVIAKIDIPGMDFVQVESIENKKYVKLKACHELSTTITQFRKKFGNEIGKWPLPTGHSHSEILVRELILKLQGKWNFPYNDEEICHCRHIFTETVDKAVVCGAHTTSLVTLYTGTSTACGTCRGDIQKIINYRLGN